jgi:hypothetical protein
MSNRNVDARDVVVAINQVLATYGVQKSISVDDVTITDRSVSDLVKDDPVLSNAIVGRLWPSVRDEEVYHYTAYEAAENILATQRFRLSNIAKRYGEGEIETFCHTHGLGGYLEPDATGAPTYRHLIMPNTYYASFTTTSLDVDDERYFWQTFAGSDGVRLRLRVRASNPNFRRIYYESESGTPIPLLENLTSRIRQDFGLEFILTGISRLCAFYLSAADYGREKEFRALYRVWDGLGLQPEGVGSESYVDLPLGKMTECGYQIDILEVSSYSRPSGCGDVPFVLRGP